MPLCYEHGSLIVIRKKIILARCSRFFNKFEIQILKPVTDRFRNTKQTLDAKPITSKHK